jgi:hypothetical protein
MSETFAERWARLTRETIEFQLEMLMIGKAHRHAGLIWFVPLCHDAEDY